MKIRRRLFKDRVLIIVVKMYGSLVRLEIPMTIFYCNDWA